jgi:hypothetical protein
MYPQINNQISYLAEKYIRLLLEAKAERRDLLLEQIAGKARDMS